MQINMILAAIISCMLFAGCASEEMKEAAERTISESNTEIASVEDEKKTMGEYTENQQNESIAITDGSGISGYPKFDFENKSKSYVDHSRTLAKRNTPLSSKR